MYLGEQHQKMVVLISQRRNKQQKPWETKEWREKREKFIKNKSCEWCDSKKYLTIDHLLPHNTQTYKDYMDFKEVIILCRKCAYARLKGMVLCKACKKHYHPPKFKTCYKCYIKTDKGKDYIKFRKRMELEEEKAKEAFEKPEKYFEKLKKESNTG